MCQQDVEWIVEDFAIQGPSTYPLANYGTVKFTNTVATMNSGSGIGSNNADIWVTLDSNSNPLSSTTLNSDGTVSISYV
jgi:hypothetical protein